MTYNCKIEKNNDGIFVAQFPDMTNISTCGFSQEEALKMAEEALNGVLIVDLERGYPIAAPKFKGGYPIEVSPRVAFAIKLRKARAGHSQKEVAEKAGMTYQQYQRLENPRKTNPTLETLHKLQKVLNHPFLSL